MTIHIKDKKCQIVAERGYKWSISCLLGRNAKYVIRQVIWWLGWGELLEKRECIDIFAETVSLLGNLPLGRHIPSAESAEKS